MKKLGLVVGIASLFLFSVAKGQVPMSPASYGKIQGSSLYAGGSGVGFGTYPYAFCASETTDGNGFECAIQPTSNLFAIVPPSIMGHIAPVPFTAPADISFLLYSTNGHDAIVLKNDGTNSHIGDLEGGSVVFDSPISAAISPSGMMTFGAPGGTITAAAWQMGRDSGSPNELHFNVPTGSNSTFSVNGGVVGTISSVGFTGNVVGNLSGNVSGNVTGNVTGNLDGIVGGTTPAAVTATFLTIANTFHSSSAPGLDWHILSHANQACTTTCSLGGCVFGWDTTAGEVAVECSDATADKCLCAH